MLTDPEKDYARGWVPFLDCKILLDSHPLIPRVETEYWVEQAILEMPKNKPIECLDLFSGSGAIGIAILKHLPEATVDFGELDASHFPTIVKSLRENGIKEDCMCTIETDVWSNIPGTYDYIFANPPYLSETAQNIQPSVLLHEPVTALFAKEDGFALIRKTIEAAQDHLKEKGALYIEHEPEQSEKILSLGRTVGFSVENCKDQYGVFRYSVLKKS